MNTTSHALWAYLMMRNTRFKNHAKWVVVGAIAPDAIYYVGLIPFLLYGWMQGLDLTEHTFWHGFFEHPVIHTFRLAGHSIAVWLFAAALWRFASFRFFWFGWLFHIGTDFFTHAEDATPVFYPFWNWVFHSPISYYDPRYYGDWFQLIDTTLVLGIGAYWLVRYALKKGKKT